ncbi:Substrate-specific component BioY of biotin ECF transporter [Devosia sp. LC5]|uniref:biotin transporter BioY n=1 Tax=Devosia sp. LC5 TaxID=1502724 RepID=UPI0004E34954|nr:biotin transporter BioY [Devosia sp. LC5]KFC67317.1 Substrate-specific component BioY of biotin ECF transporter [Devosia sp. LC5]
MNTAATTIRPSFSPLGLADRSVLWQVAAVALGTLFLALSSYVEVPMVPVPMTMQTFAVAMVGALYGWRLGGVTIVAWLIEGAAGLPVLSGGAAGVIHFAGPTAGYLFAFPIAGAIVGWLAEQGWNGNKPVLAFLAAIAGNLTCLALGCAWLAVTIGAEPAFFHGVAPFLLGAVLKSALGAAALAGLQRVAAKR